MYTSLFVALQVYFVVPDYKLYSLMNQRIIILQQG